MRILGLDYGSRRIGVAISDELGMTAQGLATVARRNREQDLNALAALIQSWKVEKIVVGYPLRLDGTEGIQCEKVERFCQMLESRFGLPVYRWDETLTTKEAEQLLAEAHTRRKKRKALVDKVAACLILQGYLDDLGRREGSRPVT
ncbi:MAG: Holliday junction resolvase RuvX [Deltaproteobacteria bacterium]|nr:Holliday junction resolvase RuvX [Deltaproteobacteria bacterium]